MKKFVITLAASLIFAAGMNAEPPGGKVVATTGWTAAFARAAGAERVDVLAPYEMKHPPEYELKPSDLKTVGSADFIIIAGYERMITKLAEATANRKAKTIRILTQNDFAAIEKSVMTLAKEFGTAGKAEKNLAEIKSLLSGWTEELKAKGVYGKPALVHFHQVPLMKQLGFAVKGIFGPGPLEAAKIMTLSELRPFLIVDNRHNEVAKPLVETMGKARFVSFYNFPNSKKTPELIDLLRTNKAFLDEALK